MDDRAVSIRDRLRALERRVPWEAAWGSAQRPRYEYTAEEADEIVAVLCEACRMSEEEVWAMLAECEERDAALHEQAMHRQQARKWRLR